ncbi:hypothetical protein RCL1_004695 [Eukaryota sp. TZLM3-RCL]
MAQPICFCNRLFGGISSGKCDGSFCRSFMPPRRRPVLTVSIPSDPSSSENDSLSPKSTGSSSLVSPLPLNHNRVSNLPFNSLAKKIKQRKDQLNFTLHQVQEEFEVHQHRIKGSEIYLQDEFQKKIRSENMEQFKAQFEKTKLRNHYLTAVPPLSKRESMNSKCN